MLAALSYAQMAKNVRNPEIKTGIDEFCEFAGGDEPVSKHLMVRIWACIYKGEIRHVGVAFRIINRYVVWKRRPHMLAENVLGSSPIFIGVAEYPGVGVRGILGAIQNV